MAGATRQAEVVVVGAGMAGLVAAVEARQRGANVIVPEKGDRVAGRNAVAE